MLKIHIIKEIITFVATCQSYNTIIICNLQCQIESVIISDKNSILIEYYSCDLHLNFLWLLIIEILTLLQLTVCVFWFLILVNMFLCKYFKYYREDDWSGEGGEGEKGH